MKNPIIVVGMHRSGTTLVTDIIEKMGIFVGAKLDVNQESLFFQDLNKWLFRELGGRWDNPPNMEYLMTNGSIFDLAVRYIDGYMEGFKFLKYTGIKNYLRFNPLNNINKWGWKDPRNVFTLPVWLELFPEAKIIYIERHGVDVANSLQKRSEKILEENKNKLLQTNKIHYKKERKIKITDSIRCSRLKDAFTLWEEYIKEGRKNISSLSSDKLLEISYEDLVLNSESTIESIIEYLGLSFERPLIDTLSNNINSARAFAYRNDENLKSFANEVSDRLAGYKV